MNTATTAGPDSFVLNVGRLSDELKSLLNEIVASIDNADQSLDADVLRGLAEASSSDAGKASVALPLTRSFDGLLSGLVKAHADGIAEWATSLHSTESVADAAAYSHAYELTQLSGLHMEFRRALIVRESVDKMGDTITYEFADRVVSERLFESWNGWVVDGGEATDGFTHVLAAEMVEQMKHGPTVTAPRAWLVKEIETEISYQADDLYWPSANGDFDFQIDRIQRFRETLNEIAGGEVS